MIDKVIIGAWLAEKRKHKGITQIQVAERLGVSKQAISKWENGRGKMYADNFIEFCRIIEADPNDLIPDVLRRH